MNLMIENFRNLIREVVQTINQVVSSAEQLSASSEETTRATHQISKAIKQVASGSDHQLKGTIDSAAEVKEMAEGIIRMTDSISVISMNSLQAEDEVKTGSQAIVQTAKQMNYVDESFKESAHFVQQLTESSNEIARIAATISEIADQTNLLALNAAIEAARAGEHGRGFAVVADEVRKLATQTSESAQQVGSLIAHIKRDSTSTKKSVDRVKLEMAEGIQQINGVTKVFEKVLLVAKNVAEQTGELSAVSEQISKNTEMVSASIEEVATIAKTSAIFSNDVVSSSEEQLASMEQISSASNYLTETVQTLQELVKKFKL
ncbi:methyl-accepting chemotaxis protein [Bacillus rubiinfantis]|uniref:methyl-accepting chemotaxis protein n=1 Tax=Bacillus rubiinfantis TaxID=1499680 RepID=UPI003CCC5D2D